MKTTVARTPGPWRNWVMGSEGCRILPDTGDKREDLKYIAVVNGRDLATDTANGEFIVRACNCHSDLLEACRDFVSKVADFQAGQINLRLDDWCVRAIAAIEKAEGTK